jgi:ABC-type protease/lipase transport system fused ATPase/permease subunit
MVASGALLIGGGGLTMGGLIACSILSGRILAPVAQIPSHLVQWAHLAKFYRYLVYTYHSTNAIELFFQSQLDPELQFSHLV